MDKKVKSWTIERKVVAIFTGEERWEKCFTSSNEELIQKNFEIMCKHGESVRIVEG